MTGTADVIRLAPQRRQAAFQAGELFAQHAGRVALELIGKMLWRFRRRGDHKEVNMIRHHLQPFNRHGQCIGLCVQ
jgi:hypothetical protein